MNQKSIIEVKPIETQDAREGEKTAVSYMNGAQALLINNEELYGNACDILRDIKDRRTKLEERRKEITKPLDAVKKSVMDLFRKPLAIFSEAETVIKKKVLQYDEKKAEEQRKVQERLDREAREKERKEKAKLEKQAEKADAKGDEETAEALRMQKESTSVAPPVVEERKTAVTYREDWYAEVPNILQLAQAVVEGKAPLTFIQPNMVALNKQARATKNNFKIQGVVFKCKKIVVSR